MITWQRAQRGGSIQNRTMVAEHLHRVQKGTYTCHGCGTVSRYYTGCDLDECYGLCDELYTAGTDKSACKAGCDKYAQLGGHTPTNTCQCRSNHGCTTFLGLGPEWCYVDSMDSCSDSVQGDGGPWSVEACQTGLQHPLD